MTNYEQTNANANKTFAIFITSYNYGEFIAQAIESVINQSDPLWNLYILDNGSTDNTYEIVEKYLQKDCRISWKKREQNIGGIQNIFRSFAEIDADYICSLSADDWLEPKFVEEARKAFTQNPEIPFVALGWKLFLQNQNILQNYAIPFPENFKGKVFLSPYLVFGNFISLNTIVFNKNKLQIHNDFFAMLDYLEKVKTQQNLEVFMMKFLEAKYGASYFINGFFGATRQHNTNLSNSQNQDYQGILELMSEPLFYCRENLQTMQNNIANTAANIATKYMSLITLLGGFGIPYKVSAEWLLNDVGVPFTENFGKLNIQFINDNCLKKSLLCLAVCVWSAFIFNCNFGGWENNINIAKQQLADWILDIQKKYNLQNIKDFYKEANKLYDGYFMPLIK